MSLSEELDRLDELHRRGVLSDAEFARAKARLIGDGAAALDALRRSRADRWLGGVCAGLGEFTGLTAWIWRAIFAVSVLCAGTGIAIYLLLWLLVPEAPDRFGPAAGNPA